MHKYINTDIVITDPCYLISSLDSDSMWKESKYGEDLDNIGINDFESTSTIYGDWSCTTFELEKPLGNRKVSELSDDDLKDKILGKFCADGGLVGVFLLDEVLKANPDFDYHITKPHTTTLIEDFDGEVSYITETNKETQDEFAYIVGTGNINFITAQTGF